jgi:hypothetical protein
MPDEFVDVVQLVKFCGAFDYKLKILKTVKERIAHASRQGLVKIIWKKSVNKYKGGSN